MGCWVLSPPALPSGSFWVNGRIISSSDGWGLEQREKGSVGIIIITHVSMFFFLYMSVYVSLSYCLSVCRSVCLPACLSIFLFVFSIAACLLSLLIVYLSVSLTLQVYRSISLFPIFNQLDACRKCRKRGETRTDIGQGGNKESERTERSGGREWPEGGEG